MKANKFHPRCAMLSVIAAAAIAPSLAVSAQPVAGAPAISLAPAKFIVVDKTQAAPLELLLFVHRADLPLRPLPNKQKENS
ncbi:hypothetical protein AAG895_15955 [Thauera sp. JM12B12]|uniref:hypothetical protein n=1 Tax=Thauera sp. JM12B12 TaxID=3142262 RepID=UPI0031F3C5E2